MIEKTCRYTTLKVKTIQLKREKFHPCSSVNAFELINNIHNVHRTRCHPVSGNALRLLSLSLL